MNTIKTIITGHGYYAYGLKSSFKMLAIVPKNFIFIDFTENMSVEELRRDFEVQISSDEEVLFFTDLAGGTPFKVASEIGFKNSKIEVVAGANLASLLETSFNEFGNTHVYAQQLIELSKKSTVYFGEITMSESLNEDIQEEGI